ncbi:MAG: hypothetical protein ABI120_11240 [Gemmatimonadaceae bacterium]
MNLTLIVGLLLLGIGVGVLLRARKASRVTHERDGLTAFREANAGHGYPEALIAGTYHYLAERDAATGTHYAVQPDEDLQQTYGLVNLDLEDAVLVIADKAGARLPTAHELDALKTQVRTVDDMLRFLNSYFQNAPAKE